MSRLLPLLLQGRQRAATLDRPILVSWTSPLSDIPVVSNDALPEVVSWQQPAKDVALIGIGRASTIEASGANRFGHAREGLARLLAEAVIEGPAPLALAGFAFDPQQPREERWQSFPDGLAVLPRFLFARKHGDSTLTVNALVHPDTDISLLETDMSRELDEALTKRQSSADVSGSVLDEPLGRPRWFENVADLTGAIAAGKADKVVLARRVEVVSREPLSIDAALARLCQRYPETTVFSVRAGNDYVLGATPETLVRLDGRAVHVDCLAGSYRRGVSLEEDEALGQALLADEKERREHAIVARALCDALREVCDELDVPEAPVLRRLTNVQHLHTPIEARTDRRRHVLELVERLHPTPATAGVPRERSLCLIRRHEPFSRGWYAGPIGWLDADGNGEFAVALRSALVQGNRASLYAGCGIVRGSDPAREYEESAIKLEAMLWALRSS